MTPLAYYHHHVGAWLAETVARGLIYRAIDRATFGAHLFWLILFALAGIAVVVAVNRRT